MGYRCPTCGKDIPPPHKVCDCMSPDAIKSRARMEFEKAGVNLDERELRYFGPYEPDENGWMASVGVWTLPYSSRRLVALAVVNRDGSIKVLGKSLDNHIAEA